MISGLPFLLPWLLVLIFLTSPRSRSSDTELWAGLEAGLDAGLEAALDDPTEGEDGLHTGKSFGKGPKMEK